MNSREGISTHSVGIVVWNKFQVAQVAEVGLAWGGADVIFLVENEAALKNFDLAWLNPYQLFARFATREDFYRLDGQYDALLVYSFYKHPIARNFKHTKIIMMQYGYAKPAKNYNKRWLFADLALVYGDAAKQVLSPVVPVRQVGNPRFDRFFAGTLESVARKALISRLDHSKPVVAVLPTWGPESIGAGWEPYLDWLARDFNVVLSTHHLSGVRGEQDFGAHHPEIVQTSSLPLALDYGPHVLDVADLVVAESSGAYFDALYCGKPTIVIAAGDRIPWRPIPSESRLGGGLARDLQEPVFSVDNLETAIGEVWPHDSFRPVNEMYQSELFAQRGSCAPLAAEAIAEFLEEGSRLPPLREFMFPAQKAKSSQPKRPLVPRFLQSFQRLKILRNSLGKMALIVELMRLSRPFFFVLPAGIVTKGFKLIMARLMPSLDYGSASRNILQAGLLLEQWTQLRPEVLVKRSLFWNQVAVDLKFSPQRWITQMANIRPAGRVPEVEEPIGPKAAKFLGRLTRFYEVAAKNQTSQWAHNQGVSPDGKLKKLSDLEPVATLLLTIGPYWRIPAGGRRADLVKGAENLVEVFQQSGWHILPRFAGREVEAPRKTNFLPMAVHAKRQDHRQGLFFRTGVFPGFLCIDDGGYSGWASIAGKRLADFDNVDIREADDWFRFLRNEILEQKRTKYFSEPTVSKLPDGFVFFPAQLSTDSVALLRRVETMELIEALSEACFAQGMRLLVKQHPRDLDKSFQSKLAKLEKSGRLVTSRANVHEIISRSLGVVTINSGVGAEALLHLKPVVTFGGSDYQAATYQGNSLSDVPAALKFIQSPSIRHEEIKKFLWHYSKRYQVLPTMSEDIQEIVVPILHRHLHEHQPQTQIQPDRGDS